MKYIALIGSNRKKNCYKVTSMLAEILKDKAGVEVDYIFLGQLNLKYCTGCGKCVEDERECPLKDDYLSVLDKLRAADGIIMISPVYIFRESGLIKNFLDRSYFLHFRPSLFDKVAIPLAVAGRRGLADVLDYLELNLLGWGCRVTGKVGVEGLRYYSEKDYGSSVYDKLSSVAEQALQLNEAGAIREPDLLDLQLFNEHKEFVIACKERYPAAYSYWQEKGWLNMDYFFDVEIDKKLIVEANNSSLRASRNE